jgi:o-succinylbenzoate synthase
VRGCGEIAPLPGQSKTDLDGVLALLGPLAHAFKGRELAEILDFLYRGSVQEQWPSSLVCGLEIALFDALGLAGGQTMAALLAAYHPTDLCEQSRLRARVPVNAVIGGATVEQVVAQARAALAAGFTCLKFKLTGAWQEMLAHVQALRSVCGPEVDLRLDANESWNFEQASQFLVRCAAYAIQYIEQPLPADDLALMARLRARSPVPLAADEALTGLESALHVLEAGAADVLILKPQLAGGLQICCQIVQHASRRGVACVLTSNLEAGPGVVATLHLAAALPPVTLPCGLATLGLLEDDLLLHGLAIEQGQMTVPTGPGLGVALKCEGSGGLS